METVNSNIKPQFKYLNKIFYSLFVITGTWFLFERDFGEAVIFGGLALIFDPFNPRISFGKRHVYQRIWLIIHLIITFS